MSDDLINGMNSAILLRARALEYRHMAENTKGAANKQQMLVMLALDLEVRAAEMERTDAELAPVEEPPL